jgi:hypothetical protein
MPNVINIVYYYTNIVLQRTTCLSRKRNNGRLYNPQEVQLGQRKPRPPRQRIPHLLWLLSTMFSMVEYTYGWYLANVGNKLYVCYNNKGKVVIRLNVEKHLNLTYWLLAPIY